MVSNLLLTSARKDTSWMGSRWPSYPDGEKRIIANRSITAFLQCSRSTCMGDFRQSAWLIGIEFLVEREILREELTRDDIRYRRKQLSNARLPFFCWIVLLHLACASTCYRRQSEANGRGSLLQDTLVFCDYQAIRVAPVSY